MNFPGNLHTHTDFSNLRLRDAINTTEGVIDYAIELGHSVIAITEHECISNAVKIEEHYEKIKKQHPDFKVLRGNEIYLCRDGLNQHTWVPHEDKYSHFLLIAKNAEGHKQIRQLSSTAWKRSYKSRGLRRVPTYYSDLFEILKGGNVIGSTSCLGGLLGTQLLKYKENPNPVLEQKIKLWIMQMSELFGQGNFYLELQPSHTEEQIYVNKKILALARELNLPYIITTDAHYLTKADRPIHKAFLNAQGGEREVDSFYASTYMMDTAELESYLTYMTREELDKAYGAINDIANQCEDFILKKPLKIPQLNWIKSISLDDYDREPWIQKIPMLKSFWNSTDNADRCLADNIISGLHTHDDCLNERTYQAVNQCLEMTWQSSQKNNASWSSYFLNLQSIIDECWESGTLVGAARGSGTGFILLYLLDITQINPLRETTPTYPWRFLNPDRVSVLDIDVDIEGGRRPQTLAHLRNVYGDNRVANVITFGTEKAKSAIQTACLAPNTLINTTNGLKPIEDINNQDKVYSIYGEEQVITPTQRDYTGELYNFNCSGIGLDFSVTHNHQLLVYTNRKKESYGNISNYIRCQLLDKNQNVLGEFLSIKDAAKYYSDNYNGSYSSMYKYKKTNGYSIIELPAMQNNQVQWLTADNIHSTDFLLTPIYNFNQEENSFVFSKQEQNPYNKKCNYIKEKIEINEELAELIGIYIAEGNINYNLRGITFTIHQEEISLRERIIFLLQQCFGITENSITLINKKDSKGLSIQVNSTPLGRWFNSNCVGLANEKRVPKQLMNSSLSCQKRVVYGCFYGDGYGRVRSNGSYEAKITSVSYGLIQDLWQISARNGYNCSVITEERVNKQTVYNLMFYGLTAESLYESKYNNNIIYDWEYQEPIIFENIRYYKIRINKITKNKYNGNVYCLETKSHNYLLNNIVSHNCRGLGIDNDIALYISSLIPSDRGLTRTLQQCMYGDTENKWRPVSQFVKEMKAYPNLWEVASKIEGLVCRYGIHAGGVVFVDEPFEESASVMRAPDGTLITSFELSDAEAVSLIKMDLLSIEALDKIHTCLDLLTEHGHITPEKTLKATYEKTIGVYKLDRTTPEMWSMVHNHDIISLFQFEQQSGIAAVELTKPTSVDELAVLNSVIRLMAQERGAEQPLNKFARFKNNEEEWIQEMTAAGLTLEQQALLKPILSTSHGICETQEKFMSLIQIPECGGFDLNFADQVRKAIAKKHPEQYNMLEQEYYEGVKARGLDENLCKYVWGTLVATSRGYGFNSAHTLSYSIIALQEMNLAYRFPIIYWNCANLICDSGSSTVDEDEAEYIIDDAMAAPLYDSEYKNRIVNFVSSAANTDVSTAPDTKTTTSVDYGKVASALGRSLANGIQIAPPSINYSSLTFTPDEKNNIIRFGLSGITRISQEVVQTIIENRPYSGTEDIMDRLKLNKLQMTNLIKCGALDEFGERTQIMTDYINLIADTKKRLNLQNANMLINNELLPTNILGHNIAVFNFNKYLKKYNKSGVNYKLDTNSYRFYNDNYDMSNTIQDNNGDFLINQDQWNKIYQREMNPVRDYIKKNQEKLLNAVNRGAFNEMWQKYALGTISNWEMGSISCYIHDHELAQVDYNQYGFVNFFDLNEEGEVNYFFTRNNTQIPIYHIHRLCGTVIDKSKLHNSITLLTREGVVTVKIYGDAFSHYDKQISQVQPNGTKKVIEKSFFTRGNKIIVTGRRRGQEFQCKKYKNTPWHLIELITDVDKNGELTIQSERIEV